MNKKFLKTSVISLSLGLAITSATALFNSAHAANIDFEVTDHDTAALLRGGRAVVRWSMERADPERPTSGIVGSAPLEGDYPLHASVNDFGIPDYFGRKISEFEDGGFIRFEADVRRGARRIDFVSTYDPYRSLGQLPGVNRDWTIEQALNYLKVKIGACREAPGVKDLRYNCDWTLSFEE